MSRYSAIHASHPILSYSILLCHKRSSVNYRTIFSPFYFSFLELSGPGPRLGHFLPSFPLLLCETNLPLPRGRKNQRDNFVGQGRGVLATAETDGGWVAL